MRIRSVLITAATCSALATLAACDRKPTDPMVPSDPARSVPAPEVSRPTPSVPDMPTPPPLPPTDAPASAASEPASGASS